MDIHLDIQLTFFYLSLDNFFVTWEGYLVGILLGPLAGFMISTKEGFFVGLSLGITLGYPL